MKRELVTLKTSEGEIKIKLMSNAAPKASENFLGLAKKGYYDGVIFHRIIKGFMIQGGDPAGTGGGGESIWGKPFEDEVTEEVVFNKPGLVAMANSGSNTNGSQFFITTAPTPWLNMNHTIFGEVVEGYDVVQKLEESATDSQDMPIEEKKILEVEVKAE
ncbi:MAG: peptidylprolyl isomerase [Candidatus Kaelpia imicola]|nr:peptidylprolyl isomerase [Candidatus Kaelpia imicola]